MPNYKTELKALREAANKVTYQIGGWEHFIPKWPNRARIGIATELVRYGMKPELAVYAVVNMTEETFLKCWRTMCSRPISHKTEGYELRHIIEETMSTYGIYEEPT